jgi:(R,R)-butanediol dehydrogenase/meso-butanediol dehydrogenase/diacetyl reductase
MRAARYYGREDVRIDTVERRSLGASDVRVSVEWCGICGSDLHEYSAGPIAVPDDEPHPLTGDRLPVTLGHEFAGNVEETGENVKAVSSGDRVAINPGLVCGDCVYCREGDYSLCNSIASIGLQGAGGGLAESVVVPAQNVVQLPEAVSTEQAALVEPFSVAIRGVRRSGLEPGDSVGVFGAGPIGLATVQAARAAGAGEIYVSEPRDTRREAAKELGATAVIDPQTEDPVRWMKSETENGVAAAYEAVGMENTFVQSIRSTRKGASVVVLGVFEGSVSVQPNLLIMADRDVAGSFAYGCGPKSKTGEFKTAIRWLADGRLRTDPLVTSRIELENVVEEGFEALVDPETDEIKVLVQP